LVVLSEQLSNRISTIQNHLQDIMPRLDTPSEYQEVPRRRRITQLTTDDYAKIAMAYEAGASMPEVAQRYGLHKATVSEILQRLGVESRDRRFFTAVQTEIVCQQYMAGASLGQLATLYGCYPTTIMRTLERAGVARRAAN
jgi:lambda repressor-like predicted transcriptional regulator